MIAVAPTPRLAGVTMWGFCSLYFADTWASKKKTPPLRNAFPFSFFGTVAGWEFAASRVLVASCCFAGVGAGVWCRRRRLPEKYDRACATATEDFTGEHTVQ
jgi:hypothetical protein